ncbi:mannonate dehydratase [Terrarubrum flagellatum]|uniref:mannonate dehydratase n=1 Tax=Terrirubrum flagellatum TaxID=2895980 RepID=UPI0031450CB9
MRAGLTLFGDLLSRDGARFAAQLGVRDVVIHLVKYGRGADASAYLKGGVGPILGDCSAEPLWTYDEMASVVSMLAEEGLRVAALENFSPNFWSDILLDGPTWREQIDGLKRLVRDAGRAGIPCIGYNFSIAGVWGWTRRPSGRGGAMTTVYDRSAIDPAASIPDGMVWNMRYRDARTGAPSVSVSEEELWERFARFLRELLPVAEEARVTLAAHPDDPPDQMVRGSGRLVNSPEKYDRLLAISDSPANKLEFCIGSLQEMPGCDIYETTRRFARMDRIAYVHFRNVRGRVPRYEEAFVDDGDIDMAEIVRILHEEEFDGVLVPDHVPELACPSPWHTGHAHAIGFMRALIVNADALRIAHASRDLISTKGSQRLGSRQL